MKRNILSVTVILSVLLFGALSAEEESDAFAKCDSTYTACTEKCDQAADGSSECYTACEEAYSKCLAAAQEQQ